MARRVSSSRFIGRTSHLALLDHAVARATRGEASAVLVDGESGVGKSRLLMEFERALAGRGVRVLSGPCVDLGGSELPYGPLVAALRPLVRELGDEAVRRLAGPGADELARLLPELGAAPARVPADPLAQSRLFEALLALLARLADQAPLVVAIEDLHWADPSTRGFLAFLVRNVRRERLLLIATYRSDALHRGHPLRPFLAEVERMPAVERLALEPFTRQELAEQLAEILEAPAEPRLVDELYRRSQGNAFFAEELAAAAGEGGAAGLPESLRDALMLRVEELSQETQRVLRTAAAAGSVVGDRLLAAAAGLEEQALLAAVREASEHNVVVRGDHGDTYSFRHALLREALYDDLLPGEQRAVHASLARALEHDPSLAAEPQNAAAELAAHWSAARELAPALAASLKAAAEAEQVWAFAEAGRHFGRAIELWERVAPEQRPAPTTLLELLCRAAEAAHLSGDNEQAEELARQALALLDPARESTAAGLVHERLGRYLLARGASREALAEYHAAAALLPEQPTAERASILAGEGHIRMLEGDAAGARAACEEAIAVARAVGATAVECSALNTLGASIGLLGGLEQAIDLLHEGKRLAEELGALEELMRAYVNLCEVLDQANRLDEATALTVEGWQRLRDRVPSAAPFLASESATRLIRLGRWDEAAELLEDAAATAPANVAGGLVLMSLGELETQRGNLEAAAGHLSHAQRVAGLALSEMWTTPIQAAQAALALAQGRPERARAVLAALSEATDATPGYAVYMLPTYVTALRVEAHLAEAAHGSGDETGARGATERAATLLTQARSLAEPAAWPLGTPPVETLLLAELCELEAARCHGTASAQRWGEHAARWAELGRPFHAAYARMREGQAALAAAEPPARAAAALDLARASATDLGAMPLVEEIDEIARRAGIQPSEGRAPARSDTPVLTAREIEVLRLIVRGHSNPQIGAALFISPKTASVHVSHILAKLNVRTRAEATARAFQSGLL